MNFHQLRHFVVTAQSGNILKAAQILNISQSGLSRSIRALETQVGLALFERSSKGVSLTEFGRHFLPGAQLMLNEHHRYVDELRAFRDLEAGSLSIGINHSFAYFAVPEALTGLLKRWPSVRISIVTDSYLALIGQVLSGDLDFALSLYTDVTRHEELHYEWLCDSRITVLGRRGHPLAAGGAVDAAGLAGAHWALIKGGSAQAGFLSFFERYGIATPPVSLRCASVTLLAAQVQNTDLLTILPEEVIGTDFAAGLCPIPMNDVFGIARIGLIRRPGASELPIGAKLAAAIRREFLQLHARSAAATRP